MALRRFVEGGADDFRLFDRAFHVRDFFRALVDEQHDEVDFGIIGVDGVGQSLEQNGFAGARRGHDKAALAASDGGHEVDDPVGKIFLAIFHDELIIRINGGEVVEKNQVFGVFRGFKAYFGHLEQGEIAFPLFGRPDLAGNDIPLAQRETADLGRRDIDVIRPRHVTAQRRTQKTETVGQYFQHAVAVNCAVLRSAGR